MSTSSLILKHQIKYGLVMLHTLNSTINPIILCNIQPVFQKSDLILSL